MPKFDKGTAEHLAEKLMRQSGGDFVAAQKRLHDAAAVLLIWAAMAIPTDGDEIE